MTFEFFYRVWNQEIIITEFESVQQLAPAWFSFIVVYKSSKVDVLVI